MRKRSALPLILLMLAFPLLGQTIPTSTLTGKVTADGAPLPGVLVTLTSSSLQGTRTVVTSDGGDYLLPFLPPGEYTVSFELSGMQTVKKKVTLTATRTEQLNTAMRPEAVAEAITVTADTPMTAVVESSQVSTNLKQDLIEKLPVDRTLRAATLLAPGVNSNGPGGNVIISGAMSFDSLYLINGAVVNENLRGQPHNLFIEDAIQETTVMSAGVSAEYGHFTGGVVSALTKSGGNDFSGTFRTSLTNESWTEETELTVDQEDKINKRYEGTLGGPFLRDRLWFFAAGRLEENEQIRQTVPGLARAGDQDANGNPIPVGTPLPVITYPNTTEEERIEGKITGSLTPRHTIVASYLDVSPSETNQTGQSIMDLDSLVKERQTPSTFFVGNYSGVLTDKIFVEAHYSKKDFAFVNSGSPHYDIIKGTLIQDRARGTRYWSPTFRKTPEGEQRDIRNWTVKGTYFLSTPMLGSHELRAGYEDFWESRLVNNHQQGSDFRISLSSTIIRGNQIFPVMGGGASGTTTRIIWTKIFVLSKGSEYTTRSVFLNDRWSLNDHWTFNLGLRYDKNDALSGDHTRTLADDSKIHPRLGVNYDLWGNGRLIFNASYSHYAGRLAEGAANDGDPAGRQSSIQWNYRGPGINTNVNAPTSSLIPTDRALQMLFDWFFANGGTDLRPFRTTPSIPGVESIIDPNGLESPVVKEYTIGAATTLGTRGYVRADIVLREWDGFYTSFRNTSTGRTKNQFGTEFDLSIIRTSNDVYNREYTGVQTQASYRVLPRLNVGATYTWSRLVGNVTGEDSGSGPLVGVAAEYPEYRRAEWNFPTGYLTGDQRHRARLWATYDIPTRAGDFNVSLLQNYDSGTRTSLDASIDPRPYVTNPGYLTPPATVDYFFGGRGSMKSDDITRTDLSLNYSIKLVRGIQLFIQPEILNLFNEQGVESVDEEILTAVDCPPQTTGTLQDPCPAKGLARFNPFTEKPVEGTHWLKGPNFGKPDSEGDFQTPRTYRVSLGIRF